MSVIIRLQNLPLTASSLDIRNFFHGLSIPDGGVHIVGGPEGDAFIAFSTDEDARQAMRLSGSHLKESRVSLLLSSRNEMYKVIEQARIAALSGGGGGGGPPPSSHHQTSLSSNNSTSHHYNSHHHHLGGDSSSSPPQTHLSSQVSSSTSLLGAAGRLQSGNNSVSSSMSPTSSGPTANDYLRSLAGGSSGAQADLSSNPALLFSTMSAIPSATLGASPNAYLNQQHGHQGFASLASATGSPSTASQQQNQAYPGGNVANALPNLSAPPPTSVFPNGNPFLIPPPNLSNLTLPFQGLMQGGNDSTSTNNAAANLGGAGVGHGSPGTLGLGMPPASTGVLGLPPNFLSSMSMAGQHGANPLNNLNPFGSNSPTPSRMGLLNNNANNNGNLGGSPNPGRIAALSAMGFGGNGPRFGNNDIGSMNSHGNAFGAGVGATGGGHRPQNFQNRFPFGNHAGQQDNSNRFQLGAIPSGRAGVDAMNNRDNNRRGFSPNRDRRPGPGGPGGALAADNMANRRRRSRSRERDRGAGRGEDRRRRRSRSRSKSRSRSRDRSLGAGKPTRRDSRDKRDHERRSRSDSSPEKNSQDSHGSRSRRDHEPSPTPNSSNTTTDEWPGAKLTGIPNDASYREIKEFIRVDVMGGSDGVVRLYDEGVAFLKLENPTEFPRVYRSNGRKLRGSNISIEGITMETWTNEYKLNKSRLERDIDREREEREKDRENFRRDSDRGKDHGRDRDNRHPHHHGGNSSNPTSHSNQRSSRFSNATHQSSCIAIRGLAPTVTTQEIVLRYLRETPYQDIVLIAAPTPTNRHSVTAFIQFESPQIAQGVIDGIVRSPLSNTLVVESCELEHLQNAKAKTNGAGNGFGKGGLSSMNSVSGVTDAKSIFDLDLGLDDETTTIIIKGAPPNVSERDVFDFFSDIGLTPMNVRILYGNDGQCTGQVICEFADNNKAKRATTKDGMLFGRGQVSVSLLPSRNTNKPKAAEDFNSGLQPGFLQRGHGQRPGLLGPAPGGGRGGQAGGSRFSNPTGNSLNIFEQALQQQQTPMSRHGGEGGGRGRGGANSRGRGERMSRFSNNDRTDFRNHNNGMGRGGGRGGGNSNTNHNNSSSSSSTAGDLIITDDEMALFNKKGCVIGLENIPYKSSMDDILQYLEDSLKIRIAPDRIIRRYDDMQKPTGDARVAFDTEFEAKLACDRLRGTYMWKRLISATIIE